MHLSLHCNTADYNHKTTDGRFLLHGETLALFPQGKSRFMLQATVRGGGQHLRQGGSKHGQAKKGWNPCSGNVAHQGPEVCLVSSNVYNQPSYITFCLVYKITNSLQIASKP